MITFSHILAPTDFSKHSEIALKYACGLAERFQATLHVLHVLPDIVPVGPDPSLIAAMPPDYYVETEKRSRDAITKVLQPEWGKPAHIEYEVKWGDPMDGILAYASNTHHAVDLLVIATHGRTGLRHMLLGSVAERIIREAPCPVMTIRSNV